MKDWLQSIGSRMRIWMQGRYGMDELSRAVLWVAVALMLLTALTKYSIFNTAALLLMLWSIFRSYSKNIYKRREEREKYMGAIGSVKSWLSLQKRRWGDRKYYKYFRCKQCKAVMRVPKGKGVVRISCRRCHAEMTRKT